LESTTYLDFCGKCKAEENDEPMLPSKDEEDSDSDNHGKAKAVHSRVVRMTDSDEEEISTEKKNRGHYQWM